MDIVLRDVLLKYVVLDDCWPGDCGERGEMNVVAKAGFLSVSRGKLVGNVVSDS